MSDSFALDTVCDAILPNPGPISCSFLSAGQAFMGTQSVTTIQKEDEAWTLNVRIQGCEFERGYVCGSMEAITVLHADAPPVVVTFWEGEIIDIRNFHFHTDPSFAWQPEVDMKHWSMFPSFSQFASQVGFEGCEPLDLGKHPYIYMRWHEKTGENAGSYYGISSGGFYYVCISCCDGSVSGFCYDQYALPSRRAFMRFELKSVNAGRFGFSSSSYEFQ